MCSFNFESSCKGLYCFLVGDCNGNNKGLGRLAVNVELSELVSLEVGVFNLFGCDVLSLLKLEDVLLSIDDAH